jgi:hypothetical protein
MATFAEYVFLHIANKVPDESFQSLKENEVFAREFPRRPKCRLPVHARPPLFLCRDVNIAMESNSKRFHAVFTKPVRSQIREDRNAIVSDKLFIEYADGDGVAMRLSHLISPNIDDGRPQCPTCGARMWIARIEPDEPGYDRRTFECPECDRELVEVVKYR